MFGRLKTLMPRSLYGRAALILIVPIVTIQLVVSVAFIQRHFEKVTRQLTGGVEIELRFLMDRLDQVSADQTSEVATDLGKSLEFQIAIPADWQSSGDMRHFWDLSGRVVIETLREGLPDLIAADLKTNTAQVRLLFESPNGPISVVMERKRVSASNPHQLLVLMIVTSILMTLIAFLFLQNQIRPDQAAGCGGRGLWQGAAHSLPAAWGARGAGGGQRLS